MLHSIKNRRFPKKDSSASEKATKIKYDKNMCREIKYKHKDVRAKGFQISHLGNSGRRKETKEEKGKY